jgi:hypothetical protein
MEQIWIFRLLLKNELKNQKREGDGGAAENVALGCSLQVAADLMHGSRSGGSGAASFHT